MFLAEGREHLQELNLAVVRIEETPDDRETVDEIFRIAHSLKGMSATMGFAGMAALTHEMEDVFELLRQRKGGLERDAIDVLLECLDALSAAVESIDTTGAEAIEPRGADRAPAGPGARAHARAAGRARSASPSRPTTSSEMADGRRVVQVSAILRRGRRHAVRARLHGAGRDRRAGRDAGAAGPTPDDVDGFTGREIDAWVVSERTDAELAAAAGVGAGRRRRARLRGRRRRRARRARRRSSTDARRRRRRRRPPPRRARLRRPQRKPNEAAPRPSASTPSGSTS